MRMTRWGQAVKNAKMTNSECLTQLITETPSLATAGTFTVMQKRSTPPGDRLRLLQTKVGWFDERLERHALRAHQVITLCVRSRSGCRRLVNKTLILTTI